MVKVIKIEAYFKEAIALFKSLILVMFFQLAGSEL